MLKAYLILVRQVFYVIWKFQVNQFSTKIIVFNFTPIYLSSYVKGIIENGEINFIGDTLIASNLSINSYIPMTILQNDMFAFQYLEELSRGYVNVASESALVSCLTSTEDRPSVEFTVFPNPAQEQINITTEDQDYYDVQVVNSRGLTVLELNKSLGLTTIDISGQETGFYMLILTTKNGRDIKKIIVR